MLIGEWFHLSRRCRRQARASEQAGQCQSYADERHDMSDGVADGTHAVCLLLARLSSGIRLSPTPSPVTFPQSKRYAVPVFPKRHRP
jgi:hypothetical protein